MSLRTSGDGKTIFSNSFLKNIVGNVQLMFSRDVHGVYAEIYRERERKRLEPEEGEEKQTSTGKIVENDIHVDS